MQTHLKSHKNGTEVDVADDGEVEHTHTPRELQLVEDVSDEEESVDERESGQVEAR